MCFELPALAPGNHFVLEGGCCSDVTPSRLYWLERIMSLGVRVCCLSWQWTCWIVCFVMFYSMVLSMNCCVMTLDRPRSMQLFGRAVIAPLPQLVELLRSESSWVYLLLLWSWFQYFWSMDQFFRQQTLKAWWFEDNPLRTRFGLVLLFCLGIQNLSFPVKQPALPPLTVASALCWL